MVSSHVEEGDEQVLSKDSGPSTRGRKNKSRDVISSLEGRFVRLELGVADTKEGMDLFGVKHGEGRGESQGADPRPS